MAEKDKFTKFLNHPVTVVVFLIGWFGLFYWGLRVTFLP